MRSQFDVINSEYSENESIYDYGRNQNSPYKNSSSLRKNSIRRKSMYKFSALQIVSPKNLSGRNKSFLYGPGSFTS